MTTHKPDSFAAGVAFCVERIRQAHGKLTARGYGATHAAAAFEALADELAQVIAPPPADAWMDKEYGERIRP